LGRVLDGCHGRGRERRGVRAVESWNGKSASCAFCVDTLALLGRGRLYQAEMQQPGRLPLALWHPTGGSDRELRARDNHRRMPTSEKTSDRMLRFAERLQENRFLYVLYVHARVKGQESDCFCGACTGNPHSVRSAWTRSHSWEEGGCIRQRCSNRAGCRWHCGIRLVVRIGRSAHEITTGGCLQAKKPQTECSVLQSVYKKTAFCAFCLHTLG
jgi:hypothetical protein